MKLKRMCVELRKAVAAAALVAYKLAATRTLMHAALRAARNLARGKMTLPVLKIYEYGLYNLLL